MWKKIQTYWEKYWGIYWIRKKKNIPIYLLGNFYFTIFLTASWHYFYANSESLLLIEIQKKNLLHLSVN